LENVTVLRYRRRRAASVRRRQPPILECNLVRQTAQLEAELRGLDNATLLVDPAGESRRPGTRVGDNAEGMQGVGLHSTPRAGGPIERRAVIDHEAGLGGNSEGDRPRRQTDRIEDGKRERLAHAPRLA